MRVPLRSISLALPVALATSLYGAPGAFAGDTPRAPQETRSANALLHADVEDLSGHSIAKMEDLVMNHEGELLHIIVGTGGALGVGKTLHAVPAHAARLGQRDGKWAFVLNVTKELIEKAPIIKSPVYEELGDPTWHAADHKYFNDTSHAQGHPADQVLRAYEMIGATLYGANDKSVGKIEDIVLDQNDTAQYMIIGAGGVLGIEREYVVAPLGAFQFRHRTDDLKLKVVTAMTTDQLERGPRIKTLKDYAPLRDQKFIESVHQFFGATQQPTR